MDMLRRLISRCIIIIIIIIIIKVDKHVERGESRQTFCWIHDFHWFRNQQVVRGSSCFEIWDLGWRACSPDRTDSRTQWHAAWTVQQWDHQKMLSSVTAHRQWHHHHLHHQSINQSIITSSSSSSSSSIITLIVSPIRVSMQWKQTTAAAISNKLTS